MLVTRCFPLLQLLVYFICIRGEDSKGDKPKVSDMGNLLTSMQNIHFMGSSLVNNLTEVFNTLARIDASQRRDNANEELKSMIATLTGVIRAQGERMEELEENVSNLRKSLDKRLRENDLKIEWALTDGTLAQKNTSSIIEKMDEALSLLKEGCGYTPSIARTPITAPLTPNPNLPPAKPASCAEIDGGQASGVHHIYPRHNYTVRARCDSSNGGGWTVIQKRFDGSVDFYRVWEEYAEGFGDPAGEYWLGLRHIRALTKGQTTELYIGVTDFDKGPLYAKYSNFSVSSEEDNFRLHVGGFSGTAADGLQYHNQQPFSTKDRDNDSKSSSSCSVRWHGAWWYKNCHDSNLNGLFAKIKVYGWEYMTWTSGRLNRKSMKASVIMIRPSNFGT